MSAINNERSGRDDNNEMDIANVVENVGKDMRGPSEDRGPYTDDPKGIEDSNPVDVPPDGGYGWVCVACVFLINGHTWGVNSSYGVFLAHYLASDTFPGATSLEYAFVGGLSISLALLTAPVATSCTRKFGTQSTLAIGIVLETAGLLGASFAYEIWHLFLSQGVAFGFGMGFLFVGSVGVVPQWFSKRRSLANGISAAGSGLGGLIYSLGTNAMIQSIGLGWAFRVLAILACVVNTVCTILVRDRNHAIGSVQKAFDLRLFKKPEFFLLLGWGFFSMLAYIVLLFSLPNYARSIGLSAKQGSVIGAILNLGQGLGRPFVGAFSDATGRINMAGTCTFLAGLFCLVIWIFAKSYGVLIFFALIVGTVSGTFWATVAHFIWDIYLHAQIYAGCMYIGAALCMWGLRAWKIKELESLREGEREKEIRNDDEVRREREREQGEEKESEEGANVPMRKQMTRTESVKRATKGLWALQRV
ncbi:major facilitator superfamily transporter [Botrytis cinerea]